MVNKSACCHWHWHSLTGTGTAHSLPLALPLPLALAWIWDTGTGTALPLPWTATPTPRPRHCLCPGHRFSKWPQCNVCYSQLNDVLLFCVCFYYACFSDINEQNWRHHQWQCIEHKLDITYIFIFSVNTNVDLIVRGTALMSALGVTPGQSADHAELTSLAHLQQTFAYYLSLGGAAERHFVDADVFRHVVKTAAELPNAQVSGRQGIATVRSFSGVTKCPSEWSARNSNCSVIQRSYQMPKWVVGKE